MSSHIHVIARSAILSFLAWLWRKSVAATSVFHDVVSRFETVERNINTVATNDVEHLQSPIEALNAKQDHVIGVLEESAKALATINRNLAILIDRGRLG